MIVLSRQLVKSASGKPPQVNLRRATSTAYYALFHAMAKSGADLLVGGKNSDRSKHAWRQVYRALEHTFAREACKNRNILKTFPKEIEDFANMFVTMQSKRHAADYDPFKKFTKSEVLQDIDNSDSAINGFLDSPKKDRLAFSAYVLLKTRK